MEKVGNSEPNKNEALLKEAERQIKERHHENVEQRMGRVAMRKILQPKNNESIGGKEQIDVIKRTFDLGDDGDIKDISEKTETPERDLQAERVARITQKINDGNFTSPVEVMQELIKDNFVDACREKHVLEHQKDGYRMAYGLALNRSYDGVSSRTSATDKLREKIPSIDKEIEDLAQSSPEAYAAVYGSRLRENIKNRNDGWMMETPYVKEHAERLGGNMNKGRPTFIHGHLGSGKTELAITTAKKTMLMRAAEEEALHEMTEYTKNHDVENGEKYAEQLGYFVDKNYNLLRRKLVNGDNDANERFSVYIVSGSKDIEKSDLYVDKSLKLTKYNGTDTAGHKDQYDEAFNKWKVDYQKNYEGLSDEERTTREAKDSEEFFKLYVAEHQAYGTEVEKVAKPLYNAIKEGKPFILDEANAIPAAILISLNDILQRRPGGNCYVPGVGNVEIEDGFSITMTGNLSTSNVEYDGTNKLNPAFLSRFDSFEYSYLPQNELGKLEEQEDMSKNQLFQVMMTYLADRQGNLELPEIDKSVNKLFGLAQFAHQTQRIFAGKITESDIYSDKAGGETEAKFKDSVLSTRNIIEVLRTWDRGQNMSLDEALWQGFISGVQNADEQQAFLKLAQNFDFFAKKEGWNIDLVSPGASVELDDIYEKKYEPAPMEFYTMADTVDLIYGDRPERDFYPEFTFDDLGDEDGEGLDEMSYEEYESLESTQEEFKDAAAALEVLAEQCGCDNLVDA